MFKPQNIIVVNINIIIAVVVIANVPSHFMSGAPQQMFTDLKKSQQYIKNIRNNT